MVVITALHLQGYVLYGIVYYHLPQIGYTVGCNVYVVVFTGKALASYKHT